MRLTTKVFTVLLVLLFGTALFAGQWVYKPMSINAQKGDVVLSPGEGFIHDMLGLLGCYWSHSGMAIDDGANIRHNTMYVSEVPIEYNYFLGIKTTPKRLNPDRLSNGLPGILTEDIDTTYNVTKSFMASGGAVLKPTATNEAGYRGALNAAAEVMKYLVAYYRVNSYMNIYQLDYVNYLIKGRGNACSGTCWYANYFSGKTMSVATIPPNLVSVCASNMYSSVVNMVRDNAGGFGSFVIDIEGLFGTGADEKVANQIVNTFAFDRSTDTSSYWRSRVGSLTAHANAPDHLLLQNFINPAGANPGVQTESTSYYGQVDPLVITAGYYYWVD
ncbi:MAG: hypothetical protein EPN93_12335 [Spirochaetes bacterium]|nr:MAG: hypothetical protein EPN93_12335 [Spirochaetota bacterium]